MEPQYKPQTSHSCPRRQLQTHVDTHKHSPTPTQKQTQKHKNKEKQLSLFTINRIYKTDSGINISMTKCG